MKYTSGQPVLFSTWLYDNSGDKLTNPTIEAGDFKYLKDGVMIGNLSTLPSVISNGNGLVLITATASETANCNVFTLAWCDLTTPQWQPDVVNIPLMQPLALPTSINPDLSAINPEVAVLWMYTLLFRERRQIAGEKEWIMDAQGNSPAFEALTYHTVETSITAKEAWQLFTHS